MKIYIAGSITNNDDYVKHFKRAENKLKKQGHIVINPVENEGFLYNDYLDMGIVKLSKCAAIYLLNGFQNSKGARFELSYAILTEKEIICENLEDWDFIKEFKEEWEK